jgi:Glutamine amidotransferase domain
MKLGICFRSDMGDSVAVVRRVLEAQTLRPHQTPHIFDLAQGSVGYLATSERFSSVPLFRQGANGNLLLISGVPVSMNDPIESVLSDLVDGGFREAKDHFSRLDGIFAAVLWDALNQRLVIATDFLGLQPMYIVRSKDVLVLSSELKGIAASGLHKVEMDPIGWASFISFGHSLGGFTSLKGVQRVPSGTVIVFDAASGSLEKHTYAPWPKASTPKAIVDTDALVQCLRREVTAYTNHNQPGVVLLSGGFDSRLLLALLRSLDIRPSALVVSHRSERLDADGRFASRIADRFDVKCEYRTPEPSFFSTNAFLDYLVSNDVATPSLNLFIPQVSSFIRSEMEAVWEGVSPGYTLAFPRIPSFDVRTYIQHRCQPRESPIWRAASRLFANRTFEHMYERFRAALEEEVSRCDSGDVGLLQFEARNQMRNRMAHNPVNIYSNDVLCFTPGISREFWSLAASIPYSAKRDFRLYLEIFRKHFPRALEVPFCSMGKLYSAGANPGADYYLRHFSAPPGAHTLATMLKRLGLDSWNNSKLIDRVVASVSPDHPDLCDDFVRAVQRNAAARNQMIKNARVLLFYWQVWRWVMEGTLHTSNSRAHEQPALDHAIL